MAHFRATIQGTRGEASRLGSKSIEAHVNGRGAGITVRGFIGVNGEDCFHVYMTGGSSGTAHLYLGTVRDSLDGPPIWVQNGLAIGKLITHCHQ